MKLFEPIRIGSQTVKNRIVMAPMTSHFAENGFVTDRMIAFYEARAQGGVGLSTVEDGIVDYPVGNNTDNPIAVDDDCYIPMLQKLSLAIKRNGATAMLQLSHAGRRAGQISMKTGCLEKTGRRLPVAPSALAHPSPGHVTPIPLSMEEIERIIRLFGSAALRTVEAGFDMIGLHCAHMYLCGQFLSPWANKRTDAYGGSLENRMRFVLEIIDRIRMEVGEDYPIVCRMNGKEPEEGNSQEDLTEIAKRLEAAGVAALHISVGFGSVLWDKGFIPAEAPMGFPEGCIVNLAENIKHAVSIPVITVNKIRHVDFAENILQEGRADMIGLGRALLADPLWPVKAMTHRAHEIHPCISCCQGCVGNIEKGQPIVCLVNPRMGREKETRMLPVSENRRKNILVVGGGPAGLEFAATAAERGHSVTLWEQTDSLGGKLLPAAKAPGKKEIFILNEYLTQRVSSAGVQVVLNKTARFEAVLQFGPDIVAVSTGSRPIMFSIDNPDEVNVHTAVEVLDNDASETGKTIVIIGGGLVGLETAGFLADGKRQITVIEVMDDVGRDMPNITKVPLLIALREQGVHILTRTRAVKILSDSIEIETSGDRRMIPCDNVIIASGDRSNPDLADELKKIIPHVYSLGDCLQPGNLITAIHGAHSIGLLV